MEGKQNKLEELERVMSAPDFWTDKERAKAVVREYNELKEEIASGASGGKYDRGNAVMTIFSGAGGDDAEDFSRLLFEMYTKFISKRGWECKVVHKNENAHGGFRNITLEIAGKGAYGALKGESGVHRLVRVSPFSAKKLRHTSFSLVEVIPKFDKTSASNIEISDDEVKIEFARSSGPGGQNVNKRETAVRLTHLPTNISVHVDSERSQHDNRVKALEILRGKLYKRLEEEQEAKEKGMYISKTTDIEWGSQIRSYVLHPYKLVKDHRTGFETSDIESVLGGEIEGFLEAERSLA